MLRAVLLAGVLVVVGSSAWAQPLGTFRWQLQPFCNVVTLNVVQQGGIYTLDGFDDQCRAATRGGVTGTAVPNPNGTIGLNLTILTTPGGGAVHVSGQLSLATLGGTWQDSSGHTGTLAFNGTGQGDPRPAPGATALYVFPGVDLTAVGFATLVVPVSAEVANRSAWNVSMTNASLGREYLLPGPGLGGSTVYRVSIAPGATTTTIYIDKVGPGENVRAFRVVRATR